jgi:serine/alanine adding enzyme
MSIFQSPEFFTVLKNTEGFVPFYIKTGGAGKNLFVQGYITQEKNLIKNFFTRRAIIFGNPGGDEMDERSLGLLLTQLRNDLAGKAIYIEFRNLTDQSNYRDIYAASRFQYEDHLNILVDLTKTEDDLWKELTAKRRNGIRRAIKEGTTFRVSNDLETLQECYSILSEVYLRAKLPLYKYSFFYNLFTVLKDEAKLHLFIAEFDGEVIGCMIALGYMGVLYDFYAGARKEYYHKYPNDLIPWEVFRWAKNNGYHQFDFGGCGKPNVPYSVRDYKKQFGGEMVNWGRFRLILNKPLYKFGEFGVRLLKHTGNGT